MTLLEAIVALVILSVVGVSCLELSHTATRLQHNSESWSDAVGIAESRMAAVVAAAPAGDGQHERAGTTVTRRPWRAGLDEVTVTVPLRDGGSYTLHRLLPATRMER